jgi:hypothetical protein
MPFEEGCFLHGNLLCAFHCYNWLHLVDPLAVALSVIDLPAAKFADGPSASGLLRLAVADTEFCQGKTRLIG